jgi:hypothetical protein
MCDPCLIENSNKKPSSKAKRTNYTLELVRLDIGGPKNVRPY